LSLRRLRVAAPRALPKPFDEHAQHEPRSDRRNEQGVRIRTVKMVFAQASSPDAFQRFGGGLATACLVLATDQKKIGEPPEGVASGRDLLGV
jgi:hypothetical protein